MDNILDTLFNPLPNAVMSSLLMVVLLYWIISFMGIGLDDVDLDVDLSDSDAEAGDQQVDGASEAGFWGQFLHFMNVGRVPLTILVSMLVFFIWAQCLFVTRLFPVTGQGLLSGLIFVPLLLLGMLLTKLSSTPIAVFLERTGMHGEHSTNFFGCAGSMRSNIAGGKVGMAEFVVNDDPVKLNVVSADGSELKFGDRVIVTEWPDDKQAYCVVKV